MLEKSGPGSYVVGLKQSIKMITAGKAKKVYLACDADFGLSSKISDACQENNVDIEISLTRAELGRLCKIEVGAAVVTIM